MVKVRLHTLWYGLLLLALAALDQSTKVHAQKSFLLDAGGMVRDWSAAGHTVFRWGSPLGSWLQLDFTYLRNTGAIWGFLNDLPKGLSNALFLVVYPVFALVLGRTFWMSHPGQRVQRVAITLILAGAVGNFADRLMLGYVIDWVHVQWRLLGWEYSYPVFNVADMAIVSGVALWFLDGLLESRALRKMRS